jgi:serine/threonine protein kinase
MNVTKIGREITLNKSILGSGSYGTVYRCTDEYGREFAVKKCKHDKYGVTSSMEVAIMSTLSHPHLNSALRIISKKKYLYIIQDMAINDMNKYTRKKGNINYKRPPAEQLRKWFFAIANAVYCLHKENIIHADIKASNVLLYEGDHVKLTDYSHCVKKWNDSDTFTHNCGTVTHNPPEVFLKDNWNEMLDIWALGCTMYEIAYGAYLFPIQDRNKDCSDSSRKQKSLNVIEDWNKYLVTLGYEKYHIPYCSKTNYTSYNLDPDFDPQKNALDKLIVKMLQCDKDKRPTISEVLSDPYFSVFTPRVSSYKKNKLKIENLSFSEFARITRYITTFDIEICSDTNVKNVALRIYPATLCLKKYEEKDRVMLSLFITLKLMNKDDHHLFDDYIDLLTKMENDLYNSSYVII